MVSIEKIQRAINNAKSAGDAGAVSRLEKLLAEQSQVPDIPVAEVGRSWGTVGSQATTNFMPSLRKYGEDIVTAVSDPLATVQTIGDLGAGALREGARYALPEWAFNAIDSVGNQEAANRASDVATVVGRHYKDRYGSVEGFKGALSEDPVGVLSDLSLPVTGGSGLVAKAAGTTGKIGRVAKALKTVGEVMDPISAAGKIGKGAGKAGSALIGWTSGVGDEPIRAGFNAAREGGAKSQAFYDNMRGDVPVADVVDEARSSVDNIKAARQAEYRQEIASSMANQAPVNWNNIFRTVDDTINSLRTKSGRFYGGDAGKSMVQEVLGKIKQYVDDPNLHNVEGLDALKQELSDLQMTPGPGMRRATASANRIVTAIVNGVRKEITRVDPKYAKTMQRYSEMSDLIKELETALSLNDKASVDTALRKLQSTMRNNVQTNYGARGKLLDELDAAGSGTLRPALAGQSFNTWAPRGIARAGSGVAIPAAIGALISNPVGAAAFGAALPMGIPRVVGEAAGAAGLLAGAIDKGAAKVPKPIRKAIKSASSPAGRQVIRQSGIIENEVEGMMTDAKGNVYDWRGNLIRKGAQ